MMNKLIALGSMVALIGLVQLVSCQMPANVNYMQPVPINQYEQFVVPAPPQNVPLGYMPRGEYEEKKPIEKEIEKDKLKLVGGKEAEAILKAEKEGHPMHNLFKQHETIGEKAYYKTTEAPSMFSSLTNSMSDAWKSITSFGGRSSKDD